MNCAEAAPLILRQVDGRLDGDERGELEAHLHACAECRRAIGDQASVSAVLRSRPELQVSARFAERVMERAQPAAGWLGIADWQKWTWRLSPVAAALLLGALLVPGTQATTTDQAAEVTLASVMETWAEGADRTSAPVTALFWQSNVSDDSLLMTVLTAHPDAALEGDTRGR